MTDGQWVINTGQRMQENMTKLGLQSLSNGDIALTVWVLVSDSPTSDAGLNLIRKTPSGEWGNSMIAVMDHSYNSLDYGLRSDTPGTLHLLWSNVYSRTEPNPATWQTRASQQITIPNNLHKPTLTLQLKNSINYASGGVRLGSAPICINGEAKP